MFTIASSPKGIYINLNKEIKKTKVCSADSKAPLHQAAKFGSSKALNLATFVQLAH